MKFTKHDSHKSRLDLLPARALEFVGFVLGHGARIYQPNNWRLCKDPSRYRAALLRHAMKDLRGELIDPESSLPHLAHAVCSGLFALDLWLAHMADLEQVGARSKVVSYFAIVRQISPTRGKVIKRFKSYERAWEEFVIDGHLENRHIIMSVPIGVKVGQTYKTPYNKKRARVAQR